MKDIQPLSEQTHASKQSKQESEKNTRKEGVTPKLDELASTLLGEALDLLAEEGCMGVLLAVQDETDTIESLTFDNDEEEACLAAARSHVKKEVHSQDHKPVRYALVYEGAIAAGDEGYQDAVIMEFGERGYKAYSAFCFIEGKGKGDAFGWTEAQPAGEVEALV